MRTAIPPNATGEGFTVRAMGGLLLALAVTLVGLTALPLAARLSPRSPAALLVAAYVLAFAEVVALTLALSVGRHLERATLLAAILACFAAALPPARPMLPRRDALVRLVARVRTFGWTPSLLVLACAVLVGAGYEAALALGTPQIEDDSLYYHLTRAALWKQHHGVGYVEGPFDDRINGNPPNAELAVLFTMVLGRSDRFVGLVQLAALAATTVAVYGLARRTGLERRASLFGALAFASLPVVALQASTALNDLVVASLLAAAALLALDTSSRASPWLAGLATALAVGTKFTAALMLPLLLAVAAVGRRRGARLAGVVAIAAGAVPGAYWYLVNLVESGDPSGRLAGEQTSDLRPQAVLARALRLALRALDVPGASGRDRYLYVLAAGGVVALGLAARHSGRTPARWHAVAVAGLLTAAPAAVGAVSDGLLRGYQRFWLTVGDRGLAYLDFGGQQDRATPMSSWYGPGAVLLAAGSLLLVARAARRGAAAVRLRALLALAPLVGIAALAVLSYTEYMGRFLVFPVALAAATWGALYRSPALRWAATAICTLSLGLALAHYEGKPSGLRLLEPRRGASVWHLPRWRLQAIRPGTEDVLRVVEERVPADAALGLAVTPSDFVYPFFGAGVARTLRFASPRNADAAWAVVRPGLPAEPGPGWRVAFRSSTGWRVLERTRGP